MPDFLRPGSDGAVPYDLSQWHWGVTCTVRPQLNRPLEPGGQYRLNANVRKGITKDQPFDDFGALYQRAAAIIRARAAGLTSLHGVELHSWVATHAWGRHSGREMDFGFATVTAGVTVTPAETLPQGEREPEVEELSRPGGNWQGSTNPRELTEIYSDFDFRSADDAGEIPMFSYGEYVQDCSRADFASVVGRAEKRAAMHHALLTGSSAPEGLRIIAREWMCATSPDIAVAHIYFRV